MPSQGGSTTTATNGQVLSRILSTISREHCRYVGVIASDTRDKLFLIRLIREHCPDVRVFVTDGDLLLTHPEYRYYMRGRHHRLDLPARAAEPELGERRRRRSESCSRRSGRRGTTTRRSCTSGVHDQLLEYGAPAFALRDPDRPDEADQRPPIWISMVAPNGAIVPLHLYTRYEDKYGYVARKRGAADGDASGRDSPGSTTPAPCSRSGSACSRGGAS